MISEFHVYDKKRYQGFLRRTHQGFKFTPVSNDEHSSNLKIAQTEGDFTDLQAFKQAIAHLFDFDGWRFISLEVTPDGFTNEWFVLDEKGDRIGLIRYHQDWKRWSTIIGHIRHDFFRQSECIAACFQNPQIVGTIPDMQRSAEDQADIRQLIGV